MDGKKTGRSGSLRLWLVVLNLAFAATPAYAAASAGDEAARIALGCCAHMVGAMIESAASAKNTKKNTSAYRSTSYNPPRMQKTLGGRCLVNELPEACYAEALATERSGSSLASKKRALLYYNRACELGGNRQSCEHAERLGRAIGCVTPYLCDDPSGVPVGLELNRAAARTAYGDAIDHMVAACENDTTATELDVTTTFATDGRAIAVVLDPPLPETLIAECVEPIFLRARVPAFEGEDTLVSMTVSLAEVPSAYHLVDSR